MGLMVGLFTIIIFWYHLPVYVFAPRFWWSRGRGRGREIYFYFIRSFQNERGFWLFNKKRGEITPANVGKFTRAQATLFAKLAQLVT
jgi:hypothetical protein